MSTGDATKEPALDPPPGVESNFDNPASLANQQRIAMAVALPLVVILYGIRVYSRLLIKRSWILEDWIATVAWVGCVSFCGTGAATMAHNGGKHMWDITAAQAKEAGYWFNVASIHYGISIGITKLSVLWLYRRVFSPVRWSPFDLSIVFLITITILFYTATSIVKIWECVPRAKIFDDTIPGTCIDIPMLLNVSGLFNTITDFIILLLPLKAVWGLNMMKKKKVAVVLAFTFGLCAPVFSLVGFVVRLQGSDNPDKTWVQPEIIQWGLAELTAGILCVSFPETGVLWLPKERRGPSTAILNGRYRRTGSLYRKRGTGTGTGSYGFSAAISHDEGTTRLSQHENPYIRLEERNRSADVGVGGHPADKQASGPPQHEVEVTREVRVESHPAGAV